MERWREIGERERERERERGGGRLVVNILNSNIKLRISFPWCYFTLIALICCCVISNTCSQELVRLLQVSVLYYGKLFGTEPG